jgi:hypothetical protein
VLNSTGISWISLTGVTKLALRSSRDISADSSSGYGEYVSFYSADYAGTDRDPYVTITYSTESGYLAITNIASSVSSTSARLNGTVDVAEDTVSGRFNYGLTTSLGTTTSWQAGLEAEDTFYADISSLSTSTKYYFQAQIKDGSNNVYSGSILDFTTLSGTGGPSGLTARAVSGEEIFLSWTPAESYSQSEIRYKTGGYPTSHSDGTLAYQGDNRYYSLTGLTPGTTYFFGVWGYTPPATYSGGWYSGVATTLMLTGGVSPVFEGGTPSNWISAPDESKLSNLPIYGLFNSVAGDIGMPEGNLWMMLGMAVVVAIGALAYKMTGSVLMALFTVLLIMTGMTAMEVLPTWVILGYVMLGGGYIYAAQKG